MSENFGTRDMRANEAARVTRGMGSAMERSARDMAHATERSAGRLGRATERSMGTALDTAFASGLAWWELMLKMQRASLASLSVYSPGSDTRISATRPVETGGATVVPVGEERLNVGTQTVHGETTRIRRRVVEMPVEQEVTLRDEHVVIERRPASAADARRGDVLVETVIEMSDSRQIPQVWKSVHVAEEVVLKREVTERTERVRDTLKRDVIEVEHDEQPQRQSFARPAEQQVGRALAAAQSGPVPRRVEAEGESARRNAEADAARREAEAQAEQAIEERRRREAQAQGGKEQGQPGRKS